MILDWVGSKKNRCLGVLLLLYLSLSAVMGSTPVIMAIPKKVWVRTWVAVKIMVPFWIPIIIPPPNI